MARTLTVRRDRDQVFTVWLDTPGSSVNVFGVTAARELAQVLDELDAQPPKLLVLASRKPGSFVNGAGLLLASALRSVRQARLVSAPVRTVYERLAAVPYPTMALIEGNCFGCGLELALACQRRVVREGPTTRFLMTELSDYRFIPLFGGTHRLPRVVGATGAAELLLGGRAWDAKEAQRRGLADVRLSATEPFKPLRALERFNRAGQRAGVRRSSVDRTRWVRPLPPLRWQLYAECAQLIERAWDGTVPDRVRREQEAFAHTVTKRAAKRAMEFFFVRHMARARLFGTTRRMPGSAAVVGRAGTCAVSTQSNVPHRHAAWRAGPIGSSADVWMTACPALPARALDRPLLVFPNGTSVGSTCEVAAPRRALAVALDVARELDFAGYTVAVTQAVDEPASHQLLRAFALAVRDECERSSPRAVQEALWSHGMGRSVWEVLACVPARVRTQWLGASLVHALKAARHPEQLQPGRRPLVFERVCAALTVEVQRLLSEGVAEHPAVADVLVQSLFDFPLEEGSLLLREGRRHGGVRHYHGKAA